MSLSRPTTTDDDGTRTTGTIFNAAWWTDLFDRMDAAYASLTGAAFTGLVDLSNAAAGQIKFPGTQNPSTNVNTLDDYEEGTWTPVIGGSGGTSGQTYTQQKGRYVKVGKLVTAWCYVELSAKGTITTNVEIQGLPFTVENTAAQFAPASVPYFNTLADNWVSLGGYATPNTTAVLLHGRQAASTTSTTLTTSNIANTTALMMTLSYTATA